MKSFYLVLLSYQIGSNINEKTEGLHSPSFFKAKIKCNEITNLSPEKTLNENHPLTLLAHQSNKEALCYYQAMKVDDSIQFK